MAKKHTGKGAVGKNTGGPARRLIRRLENKGMSRKQIARIANRDVSTINSIAAGGIKNPPNDLVARLRKMA